ncbi:MAG: DUF1566 domain-containing protein [Alphaproteobacteria bacterium]
MMMRRGILSAVLLLALMVFSFEAVAQDCSAPDGDRGTMVYSSDYGALQACTSKGWVALHPPACPDGDGCDPCLPMNSPASGTTCADGTIYAGLSPDGNVPMFTTPADAPTLMSWNDGSDFWLDTDMENCTSMSPSFQESCRTGRANTNLLVSLGSSPSPAPYVAANYCYDLDAHGHTDWYLPSQDELDVLYENLARDDGAAATPGNSFGFNRTGEFPEGWYWSSSEFGPDAGRLPRFSDGFGLPNLKNFEVSVRCVRRVP